APRGDEAFALLEHLGAQERVGAVQRVQRRLEQRALDVLVRAQVCRKRALGLRPRVRYCSAFLAAKSTVGTSSSAGSRSRTITSTSVVSRETGGIARRTASGPKRMPLANTETITRSGESPPAPPRIRGASR